MKFTPNTCACCGQTTNYAMALDRGSALIVLAVANAVRRLDRNCVHLVREMLSTESLSLADLVESGRMTVRMIDNAHRARYHGLIAFVERGSGEYLITSKGVAFIHGKEIPKVAIIDKVQGKNAGYWEPGGTTTIFKLLKERDLWDGLLATARACFPEVISGSQSLFV